MKKRQIFVLGAIAVMTVSCDTGGSISTDVALKSDKDSLSYMFGVDRAAQGLEGYLYQMGVLADSSEVKFRYEGKIQDAENDEQKQKLTAMMRNSIDSLKKVNEKNMTDFYAGLQKGFDSKDGDAAFMRGQDIGGQLKLMVRDFSKSIYGADSKEMLDKEAFLAGVVSTLKKEKPLIENSQMLFQAKMRQVQEEQMKSQFADEISKNEKFLEDNKTKEGVVVLPSGLQYKIINEGNGVKPRPTDKVKVHYHGTLTDGTVFDSSVDRGEPIEFGVTQVIQGWSEALQLMPVGSKWQLYIPYNLAYGSRGSGKIGPFATLIFDVELLGIEK